MRKLMMMAVVLVLAAVTASAAPLCTDPAIIGTNVLGPGFTCELGGLTFENFGSSMSGPGAPALIYLAAGTGTDPWQTQTGVFGSVVNLFFQTNFNAFPTDFRDILFSYDIAGASSVIGIDGWMGGAGPRNITETACADDLCESRLAEMFLTPEAPLGYMGLSGGVSTLYIQKNISLFGIPTGMPGGPVSATMSEFSQSYHTPIPEPMTFVLIGTGLLGLSVLGRRRAKK